MPHKVRSDNPYLRLLIKLYKFLYSRVPSGFNKVVLKRLHHSRSNKIPISLQSLVKRLKNRTEKVAVIVGTVTDDLRVLELPALKVCALNFTEAARARIIKAGGQIYTFDQLAIQRPKGTNTILFRGPRSRREVVKRRGIPGSKHSHVKYALFHLKHTYITLFAVIALFICLSYFPLCASLLAQKATKPIAYTTLIHTISFQAQGQVCWKEVRACSWKKGFPWIQGVKFCIAFASLVINGKNAHCLFSHIFISLFFCYAAVLASKVIRISICFQLAVLLRCAVVLRGMQGCRFCSIVQH